MIFSCTANRKLELCTYTGYSHYLFSSPGFYGTTVVNVLPEIKKKRLYTRVKILFVLLQQIPSFISNALFLTKVCLRVYNRQSQQRPFYRSRKGDSYGTEVVPKISQWSAVLNINSGNLINYCPT